MSISDNINENNSGNGRLWEFMQIQDISARIDNIYINLRDVVKKYGSDPPDYSEQIHEIKNLFNNHLGKVKSLTADWNQKLKHKTQENNKLRDQIKILRAQNNNSSRSQILQQGIDSYIQSKTANIARALQSMEQEKATAVDRYNKEKKRGDLLKQKMEDLQDKTQTLMKSINEMRSNDKYNVNNLNNDLMKERDEWRNKYNALNIKYEQKKFELDEKVSSEIQGICEQIASTKPFDAERTRSLWKKDLDELNDIYKQKMQQKEIEWQQAKNQSIKILDEEYKHIEQRLKERLDSQNNEIEELKKTIEINEKKYKQELNRSSTKNQDLNEKINLLNQEIKNLQDGKRQKQQIINRNYKEIMELQTQLSQYKILWEHFFGLNAPLQPEIENVKDNIQRIERIHNIKPPVPRKKRKVSVSSLSDWLLQNELAPLLIDGIPKPSDQYQRFQLFNYTQDSLKFNGFSIENGIGQSFKIDDNIEIRPHGYCYIALKKKRSKTDIKVPSSFQFSFKSDEKLFLCDSDGVKKQIFPPRTGAHKSLAEFKESPLKATPFGDANAPVRGVIIENVTGKPITLVNMAFENERGTFKKKIPIKEIGIYGRLRLVCAKDNNPYAAGLQSSDLVIPSDAINYKLKDKLLIKDMYQNQFELYEYGPQRGDFNHNRNDRSIYGGSSVNDGCFVM